MKLYICPGCKKVVPDGKLCSDDMNCYACRTRSNRSDLIEVDTEKVLNAQSQQSSNPWNTQKQNSLYGGNYSPVDPRITEVMNNPKVPGVMRGMMQSVVEAGLRQMGDMQMDQVPVIHSLDELRLIRGACWEDNQIGFGSSRTLVIKNETNIGLLVFGVIWLLFTVPTLGGFLLPMAFEGEFEAVKIVMILFPLIFWGAGIWMLYSGIKSIFGKTWVEVTTDALIIETGMSRKGKTVTIKRSPNTFVDLDRTGSQNNRSMFRVILADEDGQKIVLGSDMYVYDARSLAFMMKTLLAAQI